MGAAWVRCPDCDDFWCTIHNKHAYDCRCPGIETWSKRGIDPYSEGGPGVDGKAGSAIKQPRPNSRTRVSRPGGRAAKL